MNQFWNTSLYQEKHAFVYNYGESLIDLLAPQENEKILDLGCGTGELTAKIAESGALATGMDHSEEMISSAKRTFQDIDFFVGDAAKFSFNEPFDAIFSNATLHWVLENEKAASSIYQALKPEGRFVAEFGGKGNIQTIEENLRLVLAEEGFKSNAQKKVWYFPSLSEYTSLLENHKFRVTFARHYDRPTELQDTNSGIVDWIEMFARPFLEGLDPDKARSIARKVQDKVQTKLFKESKWYADYVRLQVIAIKQ